MINHLLNSREGRIIISVIWGLGLALLFFRQTCRGEDCLVYSAPPLEIRSNVYSHHHNVQNCYKYRPYTVDCNKSKGNPIKLLQQKMNS